MKLTFPLSQRFNGCMTSICLSRTQCSVSLGEVPTLQTQCFSCKRFWKLSRKTFVVVVVALVWNIHKSHHWNHSEVYQLVVFSSLMTCYHHCCHLVPEHFTTMAFQRRHFNPAGQDWTSAVAGCLKEHMVWAAAIVWTTWRWTLITSMPYAQTSQVFLEEEESPSGGASV